ncbi:MAG: ATP-grasp domain-containing protein [Isosphaeraceae bacterium]
MSGSAPLRTVLIHEYVTGGGLAGQPLPASWAAEGGAMRRALAEDFATLDGVRVVMTLDARLPEEPGPWNTVRVAPGEEEHAFARLAAEADHTLCIAPETGGVLLERARVIEAVGGRTLGSTPESIALTGDKWRLALHWRDEQIPTPRTQRVRMSDPLPEPLRFRIPAGTVLRSGLLRRDADLVLRDSDWFDEVASYPAVLKPIDGAGSMHTYFIASADAALPEGANSLDVALLQPYDAGLPMSASILVGDDGRMILVGIGRQRVEVRDGRFNYQGGTVPARPGPPAIEALRAVESVEGLRGWVGVDFLWDEANGRVSVLEINPRLTTSYVGWRRLLPAGTLARVWLDLVNGRLDDTEEGSLAERVKGQGPVTFDADGSMRRGRF